MIICPFCKEDDFDLIGLKAHFRHGHCDEFEACATYDGPTRESAKDQRGLPPEPTSFPPKDQVSKDEIPKKATD